MNMAAIIVFMPSCLSDEGKKKGGKKKEKSPNEKQKDQKFKRETKRNLWKPWHIRQPAEKCSLVALMKMRQAALMAHELRITNVHHFHACENVRQAKGKTPKKKIELNSFRLGKARLKILAHSYMHACLSPVFMGFSYLVIPKNTFLNKLYPPHLLHFFRCSQRKYFTTIVP